MREAASTLKESEAGRTPAGFAAMDGRHAPKTNEFPIG